MIVSKRRFKLVTGRCAAFWKPLSPMAIDVLVTASHVYELETQYIFRQEVWRTLNACNVIIL